MATVRIRKRGKTFSYIFEAGKTPDGRRKVVEKGGFPTKDAAYEAGVAAFTDWKHGDIGITSERVTVKDFLTAWLDRIKGDVRQSTQSMYRMNLSTNVVPFIGSIALQDLSPARLDRWLLELQKKNLSRDTIRLIKSILSTALDYAVYPCELIRENPCRYLRLSKVDHGRHVTRVVISQERFHALLDEYPDGSDFCLLLVLLYHTGMRIGEALGLCWEDVDFERHTLTIHRQRIRDRQAKRERLTEPKTRASMRVIFLPPFLEDVLREQKAWQEGNEAAAGEKYFLCSADEDGLLSVHSKKFSPTHGRRSFVCIRKNGKPVNRSTFCLMLKKHGLNSHSFRHTQATRLAADGIPPADVASRLGHSTPQTTLGTYTHSTEAQQKKIADKLEKEFWDAFFDA
ncbi:MAG: tyrosine-type recombinase/integrase [Selenomonas sp.]|nr:tyrosine-type recombinase/integrase [Selenomonas sp.]